MKRLFLILALLTSLTALSYAATASAEAIYSVESPLVAKTLADVAYQLTDAEGMPVKDAKGQLKDEKGNIAATFATDENGQGLFFFVPKMCRYSVRWTTDDKDFTTDFLPVKKDGYVLSVDNTSNATYIPFDAKHPFWNSVKRDRYSNLEIEQKSKLEHRIAVYENEIVDLPTDIKNRVLAMSRNIYPVNSGLVRVFYTANIRDNTIQGKELPNPDAIEFIRPEIFTENIRVWVERPESMKGTTLRAAVYRGDLMQDECAVDMSESALACISFPLKNIAHGDVEVRLYDGDNHLLATRELKATHYMYLKKYADVRKTDLNLRLGRGISYPLIASVGWKAPKKSELNICFAPESGSLIAGVRSQVAFSAMNDSGEEVAVDGEVYSSKDSLQTAFASWTPAGGSFFIKPEKGESYYSKVNYGGKKYCINLPEVADGGRMLDVDCLTLIDANEILGEPVDEIYDRLNYWGAYWEDGKIYNSEYDSLKTEVHRMLAAQTRRQSYWVNQIMKKGAGENELVGKYAPQKYVIKTNGAGISIDHPARTILEDDIKIRLVNTEANNDPLEIRLTDDNGTVYDYQRIMMHKREVWLRFPINDKTPEGYLNIVVANPEGEILCSRRFYATHYMRYSDYRRARERDIRNILGVRRYAPATPI